MGEKRKWKRLGNKSFRMANGRIIKPGQIFEATEEEIPKAFRDLIVLAEPAPPEPSLSVSSAGYQIRHRGSNWYDILDPQGKVVNEKALRQDEARKMLDDLGVPVTTKDEALGE